MSLRVALGEDSLLVREGIQQLLAVDPEIEIVAAAATSTRCWTRASASGPTSS